jgi:hypothetical protein
MINRSYLLIYLFICCITNVSCAQVSNFDLPKLYISYEQFIKELPRTVEIKNLIQILPSDGFSSRDTVVRIGPFYFMSQPTVLLAKFKDGKIFEYDVILTKYDYFIRPMLSLLTDKTASRHPNPEDHFWTKFAGRGYGSESEFLSILERFHSIYGDGVQIESNSSAKGMIWKEKGIALLEYNSYTTIMISIFKPGSKFSEVNNWSFCAVTKDEILDKLPLYTTRTALVKQFQLRDTVLEGVGSSKQNAQPYIETKVCGIPAAILLQWDSHSNLMSYNCRLRSTGAKTMLGTFRMITNLIDTEYKTSYSIRTDSVSEESLRTRWSNGKETILATYYFAENRFSIGKIPTGYLKDR